MPESNSNEKPPVPEVRKWKEETPEELHARALECIESGFRDKTTGRLDRDALHDRKLAREINRIHLAASEKTTTD